jgi:hypothetical protein
MVLSRPVSSLSDNTELSSLSSRIAVPVNLPAARFVTCRLKDTDATVRNVSPFGMQKAVGSVDGEVTDASGLTNGHCSWRHGMKNKRRFSSKRLSLVHISCTSTIARRTSFGDDLRFSWR